MKLWASIAMFAIVFAFASCDDEEEFPSLTVVNGTTGSYRITAVGLVGYDFQSHNIAKGASQTFVLDKGMPGGYNNINVNVTVYGVGGLISSNVNFIDGASTAITLKGCGSTACYLE